MEVNKFNVVVSPLEEENVLWLQVHMNDLIFVQVIERGQDLRYDKAGCLLIENLADFQIFLHCLEKLTSLTELSHDKVPPGVLEDFDEPQDVGVVKLVEQGDLGPEPTHHLFVHEGFLKDSNRPPCLCLDLLAHSDLSECSFAD